ncbi:hypothetical protein CLV92_10179 [Kineococcus xinjiangensis]|uniref:Phosphodiesterase n=1 Tax=Kineococcus xinjiangensis TaxID=512762 RepID=A0A2S6IVL0_9ACTN|nr:DUF5998 family protein [Kineococcus xinjiangensis]PPK98384.1 hypothetical protein CLV92_10179 [Kineococcus xinjiangensis]
MRERTTSRRHVPDGGTAAELPPELIADVERAGYYPQLVTDVLRSALAGEPVQAHLVHLETTFDSAEVRRHVTVLALTPSRLVIAHADDHGPDETSPENYAVASTEAVALHRVESVVVSHVVTRPDQHRSGSTPHEVTLTVGWGAVRRVDLEPAGCADTECDADHGYTGSLSGDDLTLRVSAAAEGAGAVQAAVAFARALSEATARA